MEQNSFNPLSVSKYWKDMNPPDLDQLKKSKAKFTDNYFPPNTNTLLSKNAKGEYIDKVEGPKKENKFNKALLQKLEWRRLSSLGPSWKLFNKDKIQSSDVLQGELGDCYFVGSISSLAKYPYLIAEKFRTKEYNDIGYYETIFFIDGEWQIVFVDDYTPYNVPCERISFAHPNNDNVIWPLLLEKAWAKLNGGYTNIVSGETSDALFALTSFATNREETSENDPHVIFNTLSTYTREGTILTASIRDNCKEVENYGLVSEHAYSILRVKAKEDQNMCLIQLRNPWGKTDWKGEWCERSTKWTPELKHYFNFENNKDHGIFWMSITDFIYFFSSYNICHLMYGSLIKTYLFNKEKYFNSPIVYNLNIKKASDFSISVIFKHWRFNRNIKDAQRPVGLILCKFDPSNEVEKLFMKRTSADDIHLFESLPAGNYLIWLYCYYKEIKNDPNFYFHLSIKCQSDFVSQFVGLDTDFNLLQKLAVSHYNKHYSKKEDETKNVHLGYDNELTESGVTCYMVSNLSNDEWANITITPKLKNLHLLPPFQEMKRISLLVSPQRKIPLLAMRITNEASSFQIQTSTMMNKPKKDIPQELTFSRFFHKNIEENKLLLSNSLQCRQYRYVDKDELYNIPLFNKKEYVPEEIFKRSMMKVEAITIDTLKRDYPKEMIRLLEFTELYESDIVQWDKIPSSDGIYIGEVNKSTSALQGRGIYIWSNGFKYIGYWIEGEMSQYGCVYDKMWTQIFEGEYAHGQKEGFGVLIINKEERIEGKFSNDDLNGNGKYCFSNRSYWEGPFENSIRHGMGVMTYENGVQYQVLYHNGEYIGKYERVVKMKNNAKDNKVQKKSKEKDKDGKEKDKDDKEIIKEKAKPQEEDIIQIPTQDKKIKIKLDIEKDEIKKIPTQNKMISTANDEIKQIINPNKIQNSKDTENKIDDKKPSTKQIENEKPSNIYKQDKKNLYDATFLDLEKDNNFYKDLEDYSKFLKIEEDPYISKEIQETDEEKNEKMIESLKLSDKFMIEQILLLPQIDDKEMFNKVTRNNTTLIGTIINGKLNGRGGMFDGKQYDIGYFKDDWPNGFFKKFLLNKTIKYEGILNKDSSPSYGKVYFAQGSYYIGPISPKWKLNGHGVYYNKTGESWTGNFENSLMQGKGKNMMDNGFLIRDLIYEKGKIVSFGTYSVYNYDTDANINFLSELKTNDSKIHTALMALKPDRSLINPIWKQVKFKSEDIIIGETDSKGNFNGRGCRLFTKGLIRYYIGYFSNNTLDKRGSFYDEKWVLLYEGQMSNNCRNGFGKEYLSSGKVHIGYFKDNKLEGQGVSIQPKGKRFEGIYYKGYRQGKGFEIFNPPTIKKPIEFKDGNIVSQDDCIKCSTLSYQNTVIRDFKELKTQFPDHINLLQSLKETEDTSVLTKGETYFLEGYYIGELNTVGFRHGRGIQFESNKTSFYVGYFQCNQKQGSGSYYTKFDSLKYQGQYKNDEPYGKGKYYYSEGESLEGDFNEIGEGKGTYAFKKGYYWVGDFQYYLRNGKGMYYDTNKKPLGQATYSYNKKVN